MTTDREIWDALLLSQSCACGGLKRRRKSFCPGCYKRLPEGLQRALYNRDEYPDAYRRALTVLGFDSPHQPKPQPTN